MDHYRCQPQATDARRANKNGGIESLNGKIKDRIDQALVLRGCASSRISMAIRPAGSGLNLIHQVRLNYCQ